MSKAYHTSGADNMLAKVLLVLWAARCALAAPGIYDGYHGYHGYGGVGVGLAPAYGHAPIVQAVPQPIYAKQVIQAEPIDPNPAYSFSYGVSDPHTGDQKDASESLQNGVVHGSYSLVEPDGHLRKVTYTADKINGFNAVVERTGGAGPVIAAPIAKYAVAPAPYAVAAPVAKIGLNPWG